MLNNPGNLGLRPAAPAFQPAATPAAAATATQKAVAGFNELTSVGQTRGISEVTGSNPNSIAGVGGYQLRTRLVL